MKTSNMFAAFIGFASSATAQYLAVVASHSASPIHLLSMEAREEGLWLGGNSQHYCPSDVKQQKGCPGGSGANYIVNDNAELAMGAVVPGGQVRLQTLALLQISSLLTNRRQLVYIDTTCGSVNYTQAHSATLPADSETVGWTWEPGTAYGFLAWKDGLVACSTIGSSSVGPWKVYAALKGLIFGSNCYGFDALTQNQTTPDAWEYE